MNSDEIVQYRDALAAKLRSVRAGRGLEQVNLASRMQALGYSWHRQTVSSVEGGRRRLTAEEVLGLSIALETSISELMAPITNSARSRFVALPSGAVIGAAEVSGSAGLGHPGGFIRWNGDLPVLPTTLMLDSIGSLPDTAATARAALSEQSMSAVVLSDGEIAVEAQRMAGEALDRITKSSVFDAPTSESAAERRSRGLQAVADLKSKLPDLAKEAIAQQVLELERVRHEEEEGKR